MQKLFLSLLFGIGITAATDAATVVVNAFEGSGFSTSAGLDAVDDLAAGNLVRVGYFNLSNEIIAANAFNISFLNSNFVEFGTARIGDGIGGIAGHLAGSDIDVPNSDTLGFADKQIYLWVFASNNNSSVSSSISTAFEHGVFSLVDPETWVFPSTDDVPNFTSVDINDLVAPGGSSLRPNAQVVIGSFPKGTSQANVGAPNFALAAVPEPSTAIVAMLGGTALLLRRRRQS